MNRAWQIAALALLSLLSVPACLASSEADETVPDGHWTKSTNELVRLAGKLLWANTWDRTEKDNLTTFRLEHYKKLQTQSASPTDFRNSLAEALNDAAKAEFLSRKQFVLTELDHTNLLQTCRTMMARPNPTEWVTSRDMSCALCELPANLRSLKPQPRLMVSTNSVDIKLYQLGTVDLSIFALPAGREFFEEEDNSNPFLFNKELCDGLWLRGHYWW